MPAQRPMSDRGSAPSHDGQLTLVRRTLWRTLQQGHNLSLVGPAHSGKSRILKAICRRWPARFPDARLPVYLDIQPLADATQEEYLARLAQGLIRALRRAGSRNRSKPAGHHASALISSHLLAMLAGRTFRGVRVCYVLDHFEYAACNRHLNPAFFGALRSLCSQPEVSIICATRAPLWQFGKLSSCTGSAFPNVFLTLNAGYSRRDGRNPLRIATYGN